MLGNHLINKIFEAAISTGGDFAEVFCENSKQGLIHAFSDRIEVSSFGVESGVGIRVFKGLNSIYAYTTDITEEGLLYATKQAVSALNDAKNNFSPVSDIISCGELHKIKVLPSNISYKQKMDIINRAITAGKEYSPEISQMSVRYLEMEQDVQIANTEGVHVTDKRVKTRLLISAFARHENNMQSGYIGPGAMKGFEFYDTLDVEGYAREAARTAKTMVHAKKCRGGQMSVVVENGFGGLMFHEACGHSLEASSVALGASEFSGKLGQQIASPVVTLVDDGSLLNEWGSLSVDDEGTKTQRNVLIENGILKSYMIDKLNAKRMNMQPTGSGRRQTYRFAPTARMTNTFIENGESTKEEIIANTERGLFVKYINGGSVNSATGDFNFSTCESYLIENGKITEPVSGATLIGNGGSILKQVDMVGNNLEIRQGYCYAGSGALFIGAGQPTVRVANMTVGGVK